MMSERYVKIYEAVKTNGLIVKLPGYYGSRIDSIPSGCGKDNLIDTLYSIESNHGWAPDMMRIQGGGTNLNNGHDALGSARNTVRKGTSKDDGTA
jgi:hypothetical protein